MRVLTTNDFVGSFFPQATSYGELPGAVGRNRRRRAAPGLRPAGSPPRIAFGS
jgi:hypothetical protein